MFHFEYHEAKSIGDILALLDRYRNEAAILAGGTALLVDIRQGKVNPRHLISISEARGLVDILMLPDGSYHIGAAATISSIATRFSRFGSFLCLSEAANLLGSRQIQNVATPGGNICKASPAADMVVPLLCMDAAITIEGPNGKRDRLLDGFILGPGKIALAPGEFLTDIKIPSPPPRSGSAFVKLMRRKAVDLAIVAVSAFVTLEKDRETCSDCRIALGAVGPRPFRALSTEQILRGKRLEAKVLDEAGKAACAEAKPISDIRASSEYRNEVLGVLITRAIETATRRAREG